MPSILRWNNFSLVKAIPGSENHFLAMREASSRQMGFRVAVLSAVLLGFLGGLVLTASADLHQLVHPDAEDTGHECLVTILNSGLEPAIIVTPVVAWLPVLVEPAR